MEEQRKSIKEYVDSLSENEVRNVLINYMVHDAMKFEDDPYEEDDEW